MFNKIQRQQDEYNYRKKKNKYYINQRVKYVNIKGEINSHLKNLGFHNHNLEELKQIYEKNLLNEGYSSADIDKMLLGESKSQGINKYNLQNIKKLQNKLIFINNYIKFLKGKISRTN